MSKHKQLKITYNIKNWYFKKLYEKYGDDVYFSIMSQYTPMAEQLADHPEINRTVNDREYDELIEYALSIGIKNAWMQEGSAAKESFIPAFDLSGVVKDQA